MKITEELGIEEQAKDIPLMFYDCCLRAIASILNNNAGGWLEFPSNSNCGECGRSIYRLSTIVVEASGCR